MASHPKLPASGGITWSNPDLPRFTGRNSGFTLLETSVYVALVFLLGTPLIQVMLASTRATQENDAITRVEERNRTAFTRIEKEVRKSMGGSLAISNNSQTLTITSTNGFDGSAPIPGDQITFTFRGFNGETVNGADDNGNGVADEGELVRTNLSTGEATVINAGFDLTSTNFALTGTGVTVTLTSFASIDRRYGTFSVSRSVTIYPRN